MAAVCCVHNPMCADMVIQRHTQRMSSAIRMNTVTVSTQIVLKMISFFLITSCAITKDQATATRACVEHITLVVNCYGVIKQFLVPMSVMSSITKVVKEMICAVLFCDRPTDSV